MGQGRYDGRFENRKPSIVGCADERSRRSRVLGVGSDVEIGTVRGKISANRSSCGHGAHGFAKDI